MLEIVEFFPRHRKRLAGHFFRSFGTHDS